MNWNLSYFPNSLSINTENMKLIHDIQLMTIFALMIMMMYWMMNSYKNKFSNKTFMENQMIEYLWTLIPMIIIILLSYFSLLFLYTNNEMKMSIMNIKILGNQWFWSYEFMNFNNKFNSYYTQKELFNFFLLETDNKLMLPFMNQIQMIFSSLDVIHSWTIPSLNLKMDCIPNQLNHQFIMILKPNLLFGQCSEMCGMNHSFMPIMIESINMKFFILWMNLSLNYLTF